jgi:hypothetical protein
MIYHARKGQTSSGEAIGILLLDTSVPFIPGDVANATTYDFPVRFRKVEGFTVARAIGKDPTIYDALMTAAQELVDQGVRAVTGDCGFMALHQQRLACDLGVPVFLSSLLPPYAAALQAAVQLPVFDYITMINFVFSAVVKQPYEGFI